MDSIKYHQNGIGNEYGADHSLTNNWNPDVDYGNEYVNVYFRIEASGYGYPAFSFTEEDKKAFYAEVKSALLPLGWNMENQETWNCDYIVKSKQKLYLHPQNFSGEVLKNEVKQIAEALQKHKTFYLRWVDLYKTVYDISDSEYVEYLNGKETEIRQELFNQCQTVRTNKYYRCFDVCMSVADKFKLRRVGLNDESGQTMEFIKKVINKMLEDGLLIVVEISGNKCIRSLNKTEQRKLKLNIA